MLDAFPKGKDRLALSSFRLAVVINVGRGDDLDRLQGDQSDLRNVGELGRKRTQPSVFVDDLDDHGAVAFEHVATVDVRRSAKSDQRLQDRRSGKPGVVGRPDETRGEVISAFVLLKNDRRPSDELRSELIDTIRHGLGAIAVVGELNFVSMLPKTRSGKIMRRVLKAVVLDREPGDITTIEEAGSVEEARQAWEQMKADMVRADTKEG